MDPKKDDPKSSSNPAQPDLGSVLSPTSESIPPASSAPEPLSSFASSTPLPDLNSQPSTAPDLNQPTSATPPQLDSNSPFGAASSWPSSPTLPSPEAGSPPSSGLDLSSNPPNNWASPSSTEPTSTAEPINNQPPSTSPLDNPYSVPTPPPPPDAGATLPNSATEPTSTPLPTDLGSAGQIFSSPTQDQTSPSSSWSPPPAESNSAPTQASTEPESASVTSSVGFTWPSTPAPEQPATPTTPTEDTTTASLTQPPEQPTSPESVPTEPAPTDLSHLINSSGSESSAVYNPPLSQPETLITPPGASTEVPNVPTEHSGGGIPKWVLGVGAGLLVAVVGTSAYFILGVGKSQEPTTSVPATGQQTLTSPPVVSTPAPATTPAATGSASFGELETTPSAQATSAGELLRQRQLQGR